MLQGTAYLLIKVSETPQHFHQLGRSEKLCRCCSGRLLGSFLIIRLGKDIACKVFHVCFPHEIILDGFLVFYGRFCLFERIEEGGEEHVCFGILDAKGNGVLNSPVVA